MLKTFQQRTTSKIVNGQIVTAFTGSCVFTGTPFTTEFYPATAITAGFRAYKEGGVLLQDAFSFMSADDREFMKTGISPSGWPR